MRNPLTTRFERRPFFDIFDEFDKMLNRDIYTTPTKWEEYWIKPATEFKELDNSYLFTMEIPGVKKEDINIDLKDRTLKVWGEKKYEETKEVKGSTYTERVFGKFERIFTLPDTGDHDHVQANYKDGILEIVIPKAEKAKARSITVN